MQKADSVVCVTVNLGVEEAEYVAFLILVNCGTAFAADAHALSVRVSSPVNGTVCETLLELPTAPVPYAPMTGTARYALMPLKVHAPHAP